MLRSVIATTAFIVALLVTQLSAFAHTVEYCVRCTAPDAQYRCLPQLSDELRQVLPDRRVLKFACIKDIAKAYQHDKCTVRDTIGEPCAGATVVLNLAELAEQYARRIPDPVRRSLSGANKTATVPPGGQQVKPEDPNAPPKTVIEFAKRTAETSNKQINKAGKAVKDAGSYVGGAAKKSWRCLSSLFSNC